MVHLIGLCITRGSGTGHIAFLVAWELSSTVKNILIITACGIFLHRFYQTTTVSIPLQRNPFFWVIPGLLVTALADIFMEFIFQKLAVRTCLPVIRKL